MFRPKPNKLVLFVFALITGFIAAIAESFVGASFWNWFLPPVFPNVPHMTVTHALGIAFVIAAFYPGLTLAQSIEDYSDGLVKLAEKLFMTAFTLAVGFLVHITMF